MLIIPGGLLSLTRFWVAIMIPDVVVSAQAPTTMAALGAAALDHSASRIASMSSGFTSGSSQLLVPLGGAGCTVASDPAVYWDRPNVLRKVVQSSELNKSVSSITAMVCPVPVMPLLKTGLKS